MGGQFPVIRLIPSHTLDSPGYGINSLGPSDTIWWQRSVSTLAQVMACCLTAPNHYLIQCWLIQCCPKTVTRSPNATHKRNGRPIIAPKDARFATNEFPKYFSPFHVCDIETGPLFTAVRCLNLRYRSCNVASYTTIVLLWNMTGS